jgi:hypothetical protein
MAAESIESLLISLAADLDPSIPYAARLRARGYRTKAAVRAADSAKKLEEDCELLPGDANLIWKAAGGGQGRQLLKGWW